MYPISIFQAAYAHAGHTCTAYLAYGKVVSRYFARAKHLSQPQKAKPRSRPPDHSLSIPRALLRCNPSVVTLNLAVGFQTSVSAERFPMCRDFLPSLQTNSQLYVTIPPITWLEILSERDREQHRVVLLFARATHRQTIALAITL